MTAPKTNDEDDPSGPQTSQSSQSSSPTKKHIPSASTGSTPVRKAAIPNKDGTPRATPGAVRPRSATTRTHPTLLSDFLLGRPSPARVAADRQAAREAAQARRLSLEMVKHEMRQAAVMRVQAPGGVHDRVKKWQKANLAAIAGADPFATPSEPSEMNIQVDDESVTEEDRMRIKARQKKSTPKVAAGRKTDGGESSKGSQEDIRLSNPPKKRVVSDTNWMKNKKNNPSRSRSPKPKPDESTGSPIPKDFLARTAANPSVSKKVKDWANKVEVPSEVSSNRHSIPGRPKSSCSGDGIRVRPIPSDNDNASGRSSARITVKSNGSRKGKEPEGDGIRVKPIPSEKDTASEITESSRVTSVPSKPQASKPYEDDGIRIRPGPSDKSMASGTSDSTRTTESPMPPKQQSQESDRLKPKSTRKQAQHDEGFKNRSRQTSTSKYQAKVSSHPHDSDGATTVRASSRQSSQRPSTRGTSTHRDLSPSDMEVAEELKPEGLRIPARTSSKMPAKMPSKKEKHVERPRRKDYEDTATVMTEEVSDSDSWSSDSVSDMPFSDLQQTLADIPVGYSAFSELDLATGSKKRNVRPKTKRQPSFKGATNVLKKALTEGKKILTEKVEHPKPVANQPPNIETWLKATLDPFVDSSSVPEPQHNRNPEDEWVDESSARHSTPSKPKPKPARVTSPSDFSKSEGTVESRETEKPEFEEPSRADSTTPTPAGLKRSRATRLSSTPSKSSSKRGLKEKLIDAFRGESTGHSPPPLEYPSCPEVVDLDEEHEGEHRERHRSSGTRRSTSPDDYDSSGSSELTQTAPSPVQSKRKPPTNGFHELSTIISEESRSTFPSELSSEVSQSTITESTNLTRNSALSRRRSQRPGLKRRLTKHSDLISVLSLPDDASGPPRTRSRRSARSVRRPSTRLGGATIDGLLLEFDDDEDLYMRELKTLVDGVIPVLLTQFVNNTSRARQDLFGSPPQKYKEDTLDNAVVNMGIILDSLRNHHRLCPPLTDLHRLIGWLESVHSIYNNYLDVWRLGFQGIIVNLAPKSFDDGDSLINAMPRNEQGDVLNEDGERIDVAHLLKRPLARIKWITKFIKGYQSISGSKGLEALVAKWEVLQEKAKRRHKEENARVVDEDAKNSDTSRTRDLRTLEALENIKVDRFRQVFAKDTFDLDLRHSNGQRLECQVELIIRDNQVFKSDPGDLLIRETGNSGRSWLLFAPILGGRFSARTGDNKHQLVVMIRGSRDEWFELLSLKTDNKEQVLDWLNMLGHAPIPPAIKEPTPSTSQPKVPSPKSAANEIPLGESKLGRKLVLSRSSTKPAEDHVEPTPHKQSRPTTPTSAHQSEASTPSPERTPTRDTYLKAERRSDDTDEDYLHSFGNHDDLAFKKSPPNSKPYRDDGAPPPPVHRSFKSKKAPVLSPPVDQNTARLKRRTSSPLKHEYHPSDVSSEGSTSPISGSEDEDSVSDESSDDELEAVDIPDTTPAISIKKNTNPFTESIYSESTTSFSPSVSASQEDVSKSEVKQPEYVIKSVASISYWDNKHGRWQDLWPDLCSIVTTPGLIEAYPYRRTHSSSGSPGQEDPPLIALDLTPLVMLRNSTVVDLEIRSPVLSYSRLHAKVVKYDTSFFRFRVQSIPDCESLYMAVHRARMDNAKYKALEEETRVRAFGQYQNQEEEGDGNGSRRSWFGRKNSYRASARAPSQSAGSTSQSSGVSASSFLRKLMGGGNQSFDIAMSSVDRQNRFGSRDASLYTTSSSGTPPRSPSVSAANSGSSKMSLTTNNLKVRLHLLISASKWEDHGNCFLEVTRPDRGTRQNLRKYQGMEKRIIVTTIPKKDADKPVVVLDVVLGSQCFSQLGSRGVLINVWEEVKDESGQTGVAPQGGGSGGNVRKWCFQCSSVAQARWIFGLVTQEVVIG
ncbi:uncharacterized protein GGS22DRAFT_189370 [Annulohypoxylon maeteangense]|uniref:uncharacterized protein n=1 Tax=Annulohypoxylon maeteangense TaxID=1927788 RepID=UPI0020074301|nr:uncharacterized protein GGS22DRAFT_189370 [Annulohypoxylon maeteangense]KAI0884239.1 hypothetical protein GGS22DRAFT_189370 [Annulohypoxylon maeteangense]